MALRTLSKSCRRMFSLTSAFDESPMSRLEAKKTDVKHETFGLPWSFTGYPEKEAFLRYMPDRQLIQMKLQLHPILFQLYNIYTSVLTALAAHNLTPVAAYLEDNLKLSLEQLLSKLESEGKHLALKSDPEFAKTSPKPTVNVHDSVIYRGLSHKRADNEAIEAYHVFSDKDLGLVCFTHSDLSNQYVYVDQVHIEKLHVRNRQCLLQYLTWIKSSLQLHLVQNDGKPLSTYSPDYTFGQEWLFESQLKPPPPLKNEDKSENYMEWIAKHTPGDWRVADMSGFLNGNPLAIKQSKTS